MKYIINDEVVYESDGRILSRLSPPHESLFISETTGRLLMRLLEESPGNVLQRDVIIHDVWDRYGYTGTGNSLNQYISLLRKNFAALGLSNVIETIPKKGFALHNSLIVSAPTDNTQTQPEIDTQSVPLTLFYGHKKNSLIKLALYIITPAMIVGCFSIFVYLKFTSSNMDSVKLYYIGNINNCRLYTVTPFSSEFQNKRIEIANALSSQKSPCIGNSFYILDIEDLYLFSAQGRVFITRCTFEKYSTEKISGCKDVYVKK